jgi:hypothetical protein
VLGRADDGPVQGHSIPRTALTLARRRGRLWGTGTTRLCSPFPLEHFRSHAPARSNEARLDSPTDRWFPGVDLPAGSNGEAADFPCVEQVALLRRHLRQHAPETGALVTSLPPEALTAAQWPEANRAAWGIESGLHQRLDVSHCDDRSRVRLPQSRRLLGMFRRFSHSLFTEWRRRQQQPRHQTTTDFFTAMSTEQ